MAFLPLARLFFLNIIPVEMWEEKASERERENWHFHISPYISCGGIRLCEWGVKKLRQEWELKRKIEWARDVSVFCEIYFVFVSCYVMFNFYHVYGRMKKSFVFISFHQLPCELLAFSPIFFHFSCHCVCFPKTSAWLI